MAAYRHKWPSLSNLLRLWNRLRIRLEDDEADGAVSDKSHSAQIRSRLKRNLDKSKMLFSQNTRRWPRHQVDLPVRIVTLNGILTTPVPARGSEVSRAGMALHAPVGLKPGDLMQLQFPTSTSLRLTAVVRNRTGDCLGLEFLTQLPPDDRAMDGSTFRPSPDLGGSAGLRGSPRDSCNPETLYAGMRRKQQELRQVQREIEALHMAILLLADDEKELSDCLGEIVCNRTRDGSKKYPERPPLPNTHRTQLAP